MRVQIRVRTNDMHIEVSRGVVSGLSLVLRLLVAEASGVTEQQVTELLDGPSSNFSSAQPLSTAHKRYNLNEIIFSTAAIKSPHCLLFSSASAPRGESFPRSTLSFAALPSRCLTICHKNFSFLIAL
jgi:hypothetical protein